MGKSKKGGKKKKKGEFETTVMHYDGPRVEAAKKKAPLGKNSAQNGGAGVHLK